MKRVVNFQQQRKGSNNFTSVVVMIVGFICCISLTACNKEKMSEDTACQNIKSQYNGRVICGVYYKSTNTISYGFLFEEMATQAEKIVLDSLNMDIVVEQFEIEEYETDEPMLHVAYFNVTEDVSVNQWIDLEFEQHGDTTVFYTAEPNPGLWNVSVFTCTGVCNHQCKIIKDKETKMKICSPCTDNIEGHKCEGRTTSVDVLVYVIDLVSKLSSFTSLLGQ